MPEAGDSNSGAFSSLTDAIGIGTLTRLVPRELVDEVVSSLGRKEQRKNKLPARVVVYFVMALALFYGDGYEEVMRKLAGGLEYLGTWRREWEVPTPGGLCQARQRLGPEVMRELYGRVSVPCAMRSTKGAWLAGRRLMAIDGFGMEAPDSGGERLVLRLCGKKGRSAFPFVRMTALAECGTHAIVAAEIAKDVEGEETLARRILLGGAVLLRLLELDDRHAEHDQPHRRHDGKGQAGRHAPAIPGDIRADAGKRLRAHRQMLEHRVPHRGDDVGQRVESGEH